MPGNARECSEHAKECLKLAQTARDGIDKQRFEALARRWMRLAGDSVAWEELLLEWGGAGGGTKK